MADDTSPSAIKKAVTAATDGARDFIMQMLSIFLDKNALALVVPPAAILGFMDLPKLLTLLEWMLYAAVLAGFAIQISRTVFPQIGLSEMVEKARETPEGSSRVVASIVVFVGFLMLALALWTKP